MINSFHLLLTFLKADLGRILEREATLKDAIALYFRPQGTTFPYIFWFRHVQFLKRNHRILTIIPYLFLKHFEYKYGIHTNTNIHIGKGLLIVHGGSVFINCKSMGDNCTIYQGVTIGSRKYGKLFKDEIPIIGNNVTVYTGAVVCGNIEINDDARIGANLCITQNVEKGKTIKGTIQVENE